MADAPDKPLEELEKELEKEITCAVCHGHYQQAKLLPCNHYYCAACIEEMVKHSKGRPFVCPECRKTTTLPPGGVAELDGAFFVERMKDAYGKMAKAEGKVEAMCEQCARGKAVAFCRQCEEFICENCVRSHETMKVFASHRVASLADLKRGGAKELPLKEAPLPKCPEHDELMKIFCIDCNCLVCRDCILYGHREHKSDFVKKCASESRKTLRDSLAPLLKVPVRIIDCLNDPYGIAVNNKQQLVVAETNGKKITIMEQDGKRVQTIECDKFQRPRGVASGPDGAVYVTDTGAGCLFKFSKDGKLCKTVPNFNWPFFVKVIQGQIYVSNNGKNEIKIFDMDCNAMGSITTREYSSPKDIVEHNGNLYVGSDGKRSIGVYQCNPGGKYIRHVNIEGFKLSRGLCFDKSGYLYIVFCESGSEGVYVFDNDGQLVTSFGLKKYGHINDPAGLVIDDDGFVYVCDFVTQGKVYIF